MHEGPDRITTLLYRLVPLFLLLGLGAFAAALVAGQPAGWLVGLALIGVAYMSSTRARSAVGSTSGYRLLEASRRWTADRFEIGWRDNRYAAPFIETATTEAATRGYRVDGEPVRRKGRATTWVHLTFTRRPADGPSPE